MNLFCPNASRSLLRVAIRGLSSTAPSPRIHWLPCAASQIRAITSNSSNDTLRPTIRPRSAIFERGCAPHGHCRTFFSPAIIQSYDDLPRDYRDKTGLSFRRKDLSDAEVERIFGPDINPLHANHMLRILHGRRVAGTLDDPAFAVHTAQFSEHHINRGLEYLRKTVSVDEVINAGLRAEDELNEMATEEQNPVATEKEKERAEEGTPEEVVEYKPDPIYGESKFDQIRARNRAKNKAFEKARVEEEEQKRLKAEEEAADPSRRSLVQVEEGQRGITNPKIAEYYKAAQSDMQAPPKMSVGNRIAPSAVAVFLILGFCASICMVYQEPSDRYRLLPEISTATATVGALVALNLLVFFSWRVPPLWKALNRYFILTVGLPKPITLFTSTFSHKQFFHLVSNMVPLYLVGIYLHEDLGRATFLALYFACGSLGFLGSLASYTAKGMLHVSTMGASGATMGLLAAWFWEYRDERFRIMGLPESGVHGITYLAVIVGLHLAGLGNLFSNKEKIDIISHLFGIAAGLVSIEVINWAGMGRHKDEQKQKVKMEAKEVVQDLVTGSKDVQKTR